MFCSVKTRSPTRPTVQQAETARAETPGYSTYGYLEQNNGNIIFNICDEVYWNRTNEYPLELSEQPL